MNIDSGIISTADKYDYTPIWSWPILIIGVLLIIIIAAVVGGETVIFNADPSFGLLMAFIIGLACFGVFYAARSANGRVNLGLSVVIAISILVSGHYVAYKWTFTDVIHNLVHVSYRDKFSDLREGIPKRELPGRYLQQRFNKTETGTFWDYIKARTEDGAWIENRRGITGEERLGFWMWWGWFTHLLSFPIGAFIGCMAAASMVEDERKEKSAQNQPI